MSFVVEEINKEVNLTNFIYTVIKKNILNWDLKPGEKISEIEISKAFNVSRTPIRESFKKLVVEELLESKPQRGTYVTLINLKLIEEGRFIREKLESAVIKEGIDDGSFEKYITTLQELIYKQKEALKYDKYEVFYELDERFHDIFFEKTNRVFAKDISSKANLNYLRVRIICMKKAAGHNILCQQHQRLLDAIISKDKLLAESVLKEHLNKIFTDLEYVKKDLNKYFIN